ncbi:unnamed protein product [Linum trigynum]|uniref:PilZ domain-containing protein n=1 Tax=Linum trigynum TaxID=586398 RepID=A0AAV2GU50_9ROSI
MSDEKFKVIRLRVPGDDDADRCLLLVSIVKESLVSIVSPGKELRIDALLVPDMGGIGLRARVSMLVDQAACSVRFPCVFLEAVLRRPCALETGEVFRS